MSPWFRRRRSDRGGESTEPQSEPGAAVEPEVPTELEAEDAGELEAEDDGGISPVRLDQALKRLRDENPSPPDAD